jgi:hypothetical protein
MYGRLIKCVQVLAGAVHQHVAASPLARLRALLPSPGTRALYSWGVAARSQLRCIFLPPLAMERQHLSTPASSVSPPPRKTDLRPVSPSPHPHFPPCCSQLCTLCTVHTHNLTCWSVSTTLGRGRGGALSRILFNVSLHLGSDPPATRNPY